MAGRRKPGSNDIGERVRTLELEQLGEHPTIIRRLGIEVDWAKIAQVMVSGRAVESSNFVSGTAGWKIDGDGNAEFNTVTIRGDLVSSNWDGADPANLAAGIDPTATVGFYIDSSAGRAQFTDDVFFGIEGENYLRISSGPLSAHLSWAGDLGNPSTEAFWSTSLGGTPPNVAGNLVGISYKFGAHAPGAVHMRSFEDRDGYVSVGDTSGLGQIDVGHIDDALGHDGMKLVTGTFSVTAGTAAKPSIFFGADDNTGIYTFQNEEVSFTAGGIRRLLFNETEFETFVPIFTINGTAADPAYTFTSNQDMGIYRVANQQLGIATAGTLRATFANSLNTFTNVSRGPNGSVTAPTWSFSSDTNTGMYRIGENNLGLVAGGAEGLIVTATYLSTIGAGTGDFALLHSTAGSAGAPSYSFVGDTNLGMYRAGTDDLGFATSGSIRVRIEGGQTIFSHDVDPSSGLTHDLGNSGAAWDNLYVREIHFTSADNWTMDDSGSDFNILENGDLRLRIRDDDINNILEVMDGGTIWHHFGTTFYRGPNGSAGVPSHSFTGDPNTGMYWLASDRIGMSVGGTKIAEFGIGGTTQDVQFGSGGTGKVHLANLAGSATFPTYSFSDDVDTGMYRIGANQIGWGTAGTLRFRANSSGAASGGTLRAGNNAPAAGSNTVFVDSPPTASGGLAEWGDAGSGVRYLIHDTSARKYKQHISYTTDWLADIVLEPVTYWAEGDNDEGEWNLGLIADDLAEQDYRLAIWSQPGRKMIQNFDDDGVLESESINTWDSELPYEVEDYRVKAVLAVLAAKVNRLEGQVAEQETEIERLQNRMTLLEDRAA
jgi:hypothetical protein